jgi:replicative DNA helicase
MRNSDNEANITRRMIESEQVREYEKKYLSGLLIAIQKGQSVENKLQADDFELSHCGRIYEEIFNQLKKGLTPDISTLAGTLSSKALPEEKRIPYDVLSEYTSFFSDANNRINRRN